MIPRIPRSTRPTERLRSPQPLLRTRIPSKRGATEQPNATGDGEAALTPTFWLALVVTGVATGFMGIGLMALLFTVQDLAFGTAVTSTPCSAPTRRVGW